MTNYNIKINSQYNSTEIFFEGKPEEATSNILKANGFKWSPIQSCWYGFADPDQITAALEGTTAPAHRTEFGPAIEEASPSTRHLEKTTSNDDASSS